MRFLHFSLSRLGVLLFGFASLLASITPAKGQPASSAPGNYVLSTSRPTSAQATTPSNIRIGLLSNNGSIRTVKAGLHSTGLLDSTRMETVTNNGGTPTLAQLKPFDVVLIWTDAAFQNPDAVGDTLAAYVDQGGAVVLATYAFSKKSDNKWWIGGRLMTGGYSPFQVSDRLASTSGRFTLSGATPGHPIFDGLSSTGEFTYFQNSNFTDPVLDPAGVLLARDSSGKKLVAANRTRDIVGLSIFPGSNTLSPDNPSISRLFANALIFASDGGFGFTTPFFVLESPLTLTGFARDRRAIRVDITAGGVTTPAQFDTTSRVFQLVNTTLSPGENRIIARGFSSNNTQVGVDSFTVTLDRSIPSLVVGPLVIGTTDSSATVSMQTDEQTTVQLAIGPSPSAVDTVNTVNSPDPERFHQVVARGLLPDATYYIKVKLRDRAGNSSAFLPSSDVALHTRRGNDTDAPRVIEAAVVSGITRTSAIFSASTDEISRGFVQIAPGDSAQPTTEHSGANNQFFFQHRIAVTGLTPEATYFFRMRFTDANGNSRITGFQSFKTPLEDDTTPPRITNGPAVLLATSRRTVIVYETDEPSDSKVIVSEIGSAQTVEISSEDLVLEHRIVVSNLQPGRDYEYRVRSKDFVGNTVESKRQTFRTSEPDNLAPVITEGPIAGYNGGQVIAIDVTTDEPATARLDVAPEGDLSNISTTFGGINVTRHKLILINLVLGKKYRFVVTITDPSGNSVSFPPNGLTAKEIQELSESRLLFKTLQSPGLTGRFTTNSGPDTQAPVVLAGPTVVARTPSSLTVSWQTDELSNSRIDYGTTSNFSQNVTNSDLVTTHQVTLTNLSQGTTYNFRISSVDIIGNGPTQGPLPTLLATGSTSGQPDISPPEISQVSVSGITNDRAIITWTTNEPANSFVEFDQTSANLTRQLGKTDLVTRHTVTLTNLGPGITYYYRVRSADGHGNTPQLDIVRSFTTAGTRDIQAPVISNLSVRSGYRSFVVSWITDEPSDSFVELINGLNDTLTVAAAAIVKNHKLAITDTTFLPRGAVNYKIIIGSTDPSRNTATAPILTVTTLATPDNIPPAAPASLTAQTGNNTVVLSWNANTESDLSSYTLYRVAGSDTVQVQSGITGTSFKDETVLNGNDYIYFLRALDSAIPVPNISSASASVSVTPSSGAAPSSPAPMSPGHNTEVSVRPILVIENATPGTIGGTPTYSFAIYADSTLKQLVASISGITQGTSANPTHWHVLDASLADSVVLQDGVRYWWQARASVGTIDGSWSTPRSFIANRSLPTEVLNTGTPQVNLPLEYALYQNLPNPFNPTTRIRYALPKPGIVTLTIYNILGQKVRRLMDSQPLGAGIHTVEWNGFNEVDGRTASGIYLYRIEVRNQVTGDIDFSEVKKMTLVK